MGNRFGIYGKPKRYLVSRYADYKRCGCKQAGFWEIVPIHFVTAYDNYDNAAMADVRHGAIAGVGEEKKIIFK